MSPTNVLEIGRSDSHDIFLQGIVPSSEHCGHYVEVWIHWTIVSGAKWVRGQAIASRHPLGTGNNYSTESITGKTHHPALCRRLAQSSPLGLLFTSLVLNGTPLKALNSSGRCHKGLELYPSTSRAYFKALSILNVLKSARRKFPSKSNNCTLNE